MTQLHGRAKSLQCYSPLRHPFYPWLAFSVLCSPQKHALAGVFYMQTYRYMLTKERVLTCITVAPDQLLLHEAGKTSGGRLTPAPDCMTSLAEEWLPSPHPKHAKVACLYYERELQDSHQQA